MRKFLLASAVAVIVAGGLPTAHGASGSCNTSTTKRVCTVTFNAPLPGTALVPYWSTDALEDGSLGYSTCGQASPGAAGVGQAWDDYILKIPANGTAADFNLATFAIDPQVDYDSFICEIGDSANHNGIDNELLAQGANNVGDPCDGVLGAGDPTGTGCKEKSSIPVDVGVSYRFRVYNWSDAAPCPATVTLTHVS